MALQNIGQIYWPTLQIQGAAISLGFAATAFTFDSSSDRLAWVGRSPVTDSLATIYFRTVTVNTGCTVDVRIETVTNGRPSGTLFGTNTNVNVVIADADDNAWKTATLTAAASLSKGQEFAIVIVVASGTPNLQMGGLPGGLSGSSIQSHYPLVLQDTGAGTWTNTGASMGFNWIVQFSTAGVLPLSNLVPMSGPGTITAYNSGTSPDERALKFTPPFTCRAAGIRAAIFNVAAGADFTASLWDATGDVDAEALAQATIDGDFAVSTTTDGFVDLLFATPVTLTSGSTYYLGIRADTANNISLGEYSNSTVTNAMRAMHGTDSSMRLSTRSWSAGTAGAWTDTTTTIPLIHLIIDQLDDGVSAGGSASAVGNIRGNMQ